MISPTQHVRQNPPGAVGFLSLRGVFDLCLKVVWRRSRCSEGRGPPTNFSMWLCFSTLFARFLLFCPHCPGRQMPDVIWEED